MKSVKFDQKESTARENQEEEIRAAFETFDTDKSMTLDQHEFRFACRALGFEQSKSRTAKYFSSCECGDAMSYEDFAKIARKFYSRKTKEEIVEDSFDQFDFDKNGKIGPKDLLEAFHEVGKDTTREAVEKLIKEFDEDGDGELSYKEFGEIFFPTK